MYSWGADQWEKKKASHSAALWIPLCCLRFATSALGAKYKVSWKGMGKIGPAGQAIINPWPKAWWLRYFRCSKRLHKGTDGTAFWNQSVQVLMYRPLKENEERESFSTHKCHRVDFHGRYTLKKSLIKPKGSLVLVETHTWWQPVLSMWKA